MTERTVETIDIGKGIKYAKVASRLAAFHEDNDACNVETSCEFKEGYTLFSAKLTTKKGTFTGHSLAKVTSGQKQFEKQETIAVGRALAFAGYLSSGDIASQEEMSDFRPATVTLDDLNDLKEQWAVKFAELVADADKPKKRRLFGEWIQQTLGVNFAMGGELDVADFRSWSMDDLDQCREALK
uniref:Uncharacterized protein n=1 Tax=viral metagenome TaxID=1070528 RepID=A0A6M3LS24_9ZZZZ